ncbi:hypothetical protein C440_04823 [Haloferax mucosum ATCC BAA-1512]|uniref:Uncharacterized protein n=1 Tax=Haloferax mucosum ATCC BAA-1512 TaxID=662479 RepID=M0IK80_9EURY|nr:hypothetical protein [Haloferax mucosum]ELZ96442.1 hypothetical protein C440_04823 [Haloferax mucosum ATCC BAA-1512]
MLEEISTFRDDLETVYVEAKGFDGEYDTLAMVIRSEEEMVHPHVLDVTEVEPGSEPGSHPSDK